jgi:hypothetical protein
LAARIGTLPPVGAPEEPRGEEGIFERVRSSPRLLIAIAIGTILVLAWIGWAIYVTSDKGATAGLGVFIAWPAMLAALALISLPFIGGYLLMKRLSPSDGEATAATAEMDEDDEEPETSAEEEAQNEDEKEDEEVDEDGGEEGEGDEAEEDNDDSDEESDDDSETEAKAAKS